jgi:hypothetical protein
MTPDCHQSWMAEIWLNAIVTKATGTTNLYRWTYKHV